MYTKGILARYADSLAEIDQTRFRAAIALIMFEGTDDQAICGGADVDQVLEMPALQHLASDFRSRWIYFVRQNDFTALANAVTQKTSVEAK